MTEYVPSKNNREVVGYFFIATIILNLATHLYFLLSDVIGGLAQKAKNAQAKKVKKMPKKPAARQS